MMKTEMNRLEEKLKQFQEDVNNKNSLIETLVNLKLGISILDKTN